MRRYLVGVGTLLVLLATVTANADPDALRAHLAEEYPDFSVDSIEPAPLEGLYEVVSGAEVMYISADGRYVLRGELLDLVAGRNLTSEVQQQLSHQQVEALGEENMVVYEPAGGEVEHQITVFTDTTCGYCQELHQEVLAAIDRHGIELRYLMFPRAGLGSRAAETLRDIWCADDPQAAMTAAKRGESVPARDSSCNPPVAEHFETGQQIGVTGTPYILLNDAGPVFAGYRPVEQLIEMSRESGGLRE